MVIRMMEDRDIDQVSAIEDASFSVPWSKKEITECLHKEDLYTFLVAEEEDRIIGYVSLIKVLDEGDIANIAVEEEFRGQGVGSALMESAIEYAKNLGFRQLALEVRRSNRAAILLYGKYDFLQAGMRKDYYSKPTEDALIFVRDLS